MASVSIRRRDTASGPRFQVRYRLFGRAYPVIHGGSFKTMKEAKIRRDLVAGELAAGRNPAETLKAITPKPKRTAADAYEVWKASRLDLDARTLDNCDGHWKRLETRLRAAWPSMRSPLSTVQEWISDNGQGEKKLTPKVLRDYMSTLKQTLDYAGIEPNPGPRSARSIPDRGAGDPGPALGQARARDARPHAAAASADCSSSS